MRIPEKLPAYLWNELMKTAGYVANHTPMQKQGYKTLFEMVVGAPPNLSHFWKIEYTTYALDKHLPCEQKLKKRANSCHHLGYYSINVFQIGISSQHKIFCRRDILYRENTLYNPLKPDLSQLTLESMMQ